MALRWFARDAETAVRSRDCPVCGASGSRIRTIGTLATTGQIVFERDRYHLGECRTCRLVFISPEPSLEDLGRIYLESNQFTDGVYTDAARVSAILEYMSDCLTRIAGRCGWRRNARISLLEVGAGLAWMARAAKALNPDSVTTAQDISPEAVARCPWVDSYIQADVFDARLDARMPYDVISLTHVIEHLIDPLTVLGRCRGLLQARGVILVTAPHRPIGWRHGSDDISLWHSYSYNHVPAHIQYFSRDSMNRLARRAGCRLTHWNAQSEDGQAFEAWLQPA